MKRIDGISLAQSGSATWEGDRTKGSSLVGVTIQDLSIPSKVRGVGTIFFLVVGGGGKNVDKPSPSDCQYLWGGGTGISFPLR